MGELGLRGLHGEVELSRPERVLEYLGRYTHRVAISNNRLLESDEGETRFRWRDYSRGNKRRVMTVSSEEFIRRFLLRTLPAGFQRIRHYGWLASSGKKERVRLCLELIARAGHPAGLLPTGLVTARQRRENPGVPASHVCPRCGQGIMVRVENVPVIRCIRSLGDTSSALPRAPGVRSRPLSRHGAGSV